jgi:hypothetical protein
MALVLLKVRLNIFYTTGLDIEQALHGIAIAISSRVLKLRPLLQKLYSQIGKTPIIGRSVFTSVCAPQRDGSGARKPPPLLIVTWP